MRTSINKKSDFDFIVLDNEGNAIDMPTSDFTLDLWTWGSKCRFRASSIGGVLKGCKNDGGKLRVYVDNPGFVPGKLVGEWITYAASEDYADGSQRTCRYISDFGIDMVDGDSITNEQQVLAMMQYIQGASAYEIACEHGYQGTEEEWLNSLSLESVNAANECRELMAQLSAAEDVRKANEQTRIANEKTRAENESSRSFEESNRADAESTRIHNESVRHNREEIRQDAENYRITHENSRESNETMRQNSETARVTAEESRVTAEESRQANEQTRATAEASRIAAESSRDRTHDRLKAAMREYADAESLREESEAERREAEQYRIEYEQSRQSSEADRATNERNRATAEQQRVTNETARSNAESSRATAETARQTAETARQEAEQGRVTAEQQRAEAEAARAEEFATFEGKITAKEDAANKVTSLSNPSDVTFPTSKAVSDALDLKQDKVYRTIYDVSTEFPTNGADGTNVYDITTAIAQVTGDKRKYVKYLTFINSQGKRELWQYSGNWVYFSSANLVDWQKMRPSMYFECNYDENLPVIRNQVPVSQRVSGQIIHWVDPNNVNKYSLYIGKDNLVGESYWQDSNFVDIYSASNVDSEISRRTNPIYVTGNNKYNCVVKELYLEKYEEGKKYIITQFSNLHNNGSIWVSYEGANSDYSVLANNATGGLDGSIITLESNDKKFKAYIKVDWTLIGTTEQKLVKLYINDAAKNIENSPSIYTKLLIEPKTELVEGLEYKLYNDNEYIAFENPADFEGNGRYAYINIGLVHQATEVQTFNCIRLKFNRDTTKPEKFGTLFVKKGFSISETGGTIIQQFENFSSAKFPDSGYFQIQLSNKVTLQPSEYLWVYWQSDTYGLAMRVWNEQNEAGTRCGMYFQGSLSTYKYSTSMVLMNTLGDIAKLDNRVSNLEDALNIGGDTKRNEPMINMPDDLYVAIGKKQAFYYNEFIFGNESHCDNTLVGYTIDIQASPSGMGSKCVAHTDGFTIYTFTEGDFDLMITISDAYKNVIATKSCKIHSFSPTSGNNFTILNLGASWIDINSGNKGYTPYLDNALKDLGCNPTFIGTRDAGTSGLKHEGIGGYTFKGFVTAPSVVRFKFFVNDIPSISNTDVYSNNGSTYTLREIGSGYITMNRTSGSTEPSGNILTKASGTGDNEIQFTSWTIGGSNPLWNTVTNELDFTHYRRDLCGISAPLDVCNIQLGINDCLGSYRTTEAEWSEVVESARTLINEILSDSPNCKIIVNFVGMDAPNDTGWSSLNGLKVSKRAFQSNVYYMRKYLNEMIASRSDYKTSVFIGQSVLGINRWYGYGYFDARFRYFKIDSSMPAEDLAKLKSFDFQQRSVYVYTDKTGEEFKAYGYEDGYLVCLAEQKNMNWNEHNQEFVGKYSQKSDVVPEAGYLRKGGGSASVDFPDVPFTDVYIENNDLKSHWFVNATHPFDLGYKQMAYCVAHQIAYIIK